MSTHDFTADGTSLAVARDDVRLRDTWLLHRRELGQLFVVYVSLAIVWTGMGLLLTHQLAHSWLTRTDGAVERWFVDQRTSSLNSVSYVMSMLADTVVKIAVTAVVALGLLVRFRRWRETLIVVVALILEAMTFITVTWIVDRPRPSVPRLDSSPVGSSFPSGHVAASVAYSAIVVVLFQHTRRRAPRIIAVVTVALLTVAVAFARMYRGMHNPTDVVMGAFLGAAAVAATVMVLRAAERRRLALADPALGGVSNSAGDHLPPQWQP